MQLLFSKSSTIFKHLELTKNKLHTWRERSRQRKELAQLSPYMLKDIGVSRSDAINEVQKPFWKP